MPSWVLPIGAIAVLAVVAIAISKRREIVLGLAGIGAAARRHAWSIASVLIAAAVVAVTMALGDGLFRESFLAQLLATLAGVLVGVPIGLGIARRQAGEERQAADGLQRVRDDTRRREILGVLLDDLGYNLQEQRKRTANPDHREFLLPFLRDGLWLALADTGDLRLLTDPLLLDALTRAYDYIRNSRFLEERYYDATHYPGMIGESDVSDRIRREVTGLDPAVDAAIDHARALAKDAREALSAPTD